MALKLIDVGDPAPWFTARCTSRENFSFNSVAGRYIVLCFFGSAADPVSQHVLAEFAEGQEAFDGNWCAFFGVSIDPDDEKLQRVRQHLPGVRFFWDFDRSISRLFRIMDPEDAAVYQRCTVVLDERLRVIAVFPFADPIDNHVQQVIGFLAEAPAVTPEMPASVQAPILVVPRIFEPELCRTLIRYYDERGGEESGFMREVGGRTVGVTDYSFKRRRDQEIEDEHLRKTCMVRIHDRLVSEIFKAFQFRASRIERYIVACYDAVTGGYFHAHRDNTTKGTAHRCFAVSLNLNTGEYEGAICASRSLVGRFTGRQREGQ